MAVLKTRHVQTITLHTPASTSTTDMGETYPATYTTATKSVVVFDRESMSVQQEYQLKEQEILCYFEYADFPDEARTYPLNYYHITYNSLYYRVTSAKKCYRLSTFLFWKITAKLVPGLTWGYSYLTNEPHYDCLHALYDWLATQFSSYATQNGDKAQEEVGASKPRLTVGLEDSELMPFIGDAVGSSVAGAAYRLQARIGCVSAESPAGAYRTLSAVLDYIIRYRDNLESTVGCRIIDIRMNGSLRDSYEREHNVYALITMLYEGVQSTVPCAPTALAASEAGSVVTLTWTAPSSDGGSPISSYTIYRSTDGVTYTAVGTDTASPYTEASPAAGTLYYKVAAVNHVGTGAQSSAASLTAPTGIPTGLVVAEDISGNIVATWDAYAGGTGGSAITGYNVYRAEGGSGYSSVGTPSTPTYSESAIPANTLYYKVAAVNARGEGTAGGTTPLGYYRVSPPTVPLSFTVTDGATSITIGWAAPSDNGHSAITGYTLQRSIDGSTYATLTSPGASDTSYEDTSIIIGWTYYYKILVNNNRGSSSYTTPASSEVLDWFTSFNTGDTTGKAFDATNYDRQNYQVLSTNGLGLTVRADGYPGTDKYVASDGGIFIVSPKDELKTGSIGYWWGFYGTAPHMFYFDRTNWNDYYQPGSVAMTFPNVYPHPTDGIKIYDAAGVLKETLGVAWAAANTWYWFSITLADVGGDQYITVKVYSTAGTLLVESSAQKIMTGMPTDSRWNLHDWGYTNNGFDTLRCKKLT